MNVWEIAWVVFGALGLWHILPTVINSPQLFRPLSHLNILRREQACILLRSDELTLGNSECVFTRSVESYWQPKWERVPLRNRIWGQWSRRLCGHTHTLIRLDLLLYNTSLQDNVKVLTWYFPKATGVLTWKRIKGYNGRCILNIRTHMAQDQFTCTPALVKYENILFKINS